MMSGDGLVLRIRPRNNRVSRQQMLALCDLAERFGTGELQLTNRANLQIRGISQADHTPILAALEQLDLLDTDPAQETKRNIIVAADSVPGDRSEQLSDALINILSDLPDLPAKFGFAIDCGATRRLAGAPADIRIEAAGDALVVRADGSVRGIPCAQEDAISAVVTLCEWFARERGPSRRMAQTLLQTPLPPEFAQIAPTAPSTPIHVGMDTAGAAFGVVPAAQLAAFLKSASVSAIRLTPDRLLRFEDLGETLPDWLIRDPSNPLLRSFACIGRAGCSAATVETRALARSLAGRFSGTLHVSGCSKGCAYPREAGTTLVGRGCTFDLVVNGTPWDAPSRFGIHPELAEQLDTLT